MRPSTHTPELKDSLPYKKDIGACPAFQGLKRGLVPLVVFSLKRSTMGAFGD